MSGSPTKSSRTLLLAALAIVAILLGVLSEQFLRAPARQAVELSNGTMFPVARELPDFTLVNQNGERYARAQLQGKWSVVFFGYSSCPDICPTTLSLLAQVEKSLSDLPTAQRPQIVFVSVDPKRDTPQQIAQYIHFFSPDFVGLTGEAAQLDQLTKAMGVPVAFHDLGNGAYTVDHAATLFLLDPQARMAALFSPPHDIATLAADVRKVIQAH